MASKEDKMLLISEVAKLTGVSGSTIRRWAERGLLNPARRRVQKNYIAWFTTVNAVMAVVKRKKKIGRPRKDA